MGAGNWLLRKIAASWCHAARDCHVAFEQKVTHIRTQSKYNATYEFKQFPIEQYNLFDSNVSYTAAAKLLLLFGTIEIQLSMYYNQPYGNASKAANEWLEE